MGKHTKGPWTVEQLKGGGQRIQKNGDIICWMQGSTNYPVLDNSEANADLISAAPELLEACKESQRKVLFILNHIETGLIKGCGLRNSEVVNWVKNLDNAISKAEPN